eukprot:15349579-Ditylum_brightwellii.AAC.1
MDVIANAITKSATTPFTWQSPLANTIEQITNLAILSTTEGPDLMTWSETLSKLLEPLRGLGLYTSCQAAIAAITIPMATAIGYAIKGILLCHKQ